MNSNLNLVDLGEVDVDTAEAVATGKFEVATGKFEIATGKFEIVTDGGAGFLASSDRDI
jgi:putative sterol carrier protein